MAVDVEQIPFLKQLVDSDEAVRDEALGTLRKYLASGRRFTDLELLKLWKGLFFSLYHTPFTQSPPLIVALATLHLSLGPDLYLPFARTFWYTIATQTPALDANRIDKFLALERRMLGAQLTWLAYRNWDVAELKGWVAMMSHPSEGPLGVGGPGEKVGDGVRYHILDILVDELVRIDEREAARVPPDIREIILGPVRILAVEGRSRAMKSQAKEVLDDERLTGLGSDTSQPEHQDQPEDEWNGIDE